MEDIALCDGGNVKKLSLVELMHECMVIVATSVLFVAHKQGFECTFWVMGMVPPIEYMSLLLDVCTFQTSYTFSGTKCVQNLGTACIAYKMTVTF